MMRELEFSFEAFTCADALAPLADAAARSDLEAVRARAAEVARRFTDLSHGIEIAWLPTVERWFRAGTTLADGLRAEHEHIHRLLEDVRESAARGDFASVDESLARLRVVIESHLRRERETSSVAWRSLPAARFDEAASLMGRVRAALDGQGRQLGASP